MEICLSIASLLLSAVIIYSSQKIFVSKKLFDTINKRSSHSVKATRNGGISIFLTIFLIVLYFYLSGETIFNYSYIIPILLLLVVGFYDDIYEVDFKLKFIFQIITAKIIIDNGLLIDNFHGLLGIFEINRIIAQVITIFLIVSIINAINFIDGIDGLAISVISLFIIMFEIFSVDKTSFQPLSIVLIFSFIPLLIFNYKKNMKVFLGDSGSNLLGCIVSIYVLTILSQDYFIDLRYDVNKFFFVVSVLSYPIFDIVYVTLNRLIKGVSPFQADKSHIHHLLLKKVKHHYLVVFYVLIFSVLSFSIIHIIL